MTETTNVAARLRDAIYDARRGHRLHEYEGAALRLATAAEEFLGATERDAIGYRPPASTRLVVEIDADNLREQIRTHVVEILAERDTALAQVAELRLAVWTAARILRQTDPADRLAAELERVHTATDPSPAAAVTCACPDGAVDGHVCEATS